MTQHRRILVTGAEGFIGRNLVVRLGEAKGIQISTLVRSDDPCRLMTLVRAVDAVVHLAGENRPSDEAAFAQGNTELTELLCEAVKSEWNSTRRLVPILFASSAQAELDNAYGRSKHAAEKALENLGSETGNPCLIYRLPGVFGKWCKPNYNSVSRNLLSQHIS